jgi:hypothetical protein
MPLGRQRKGCKSETHGQWKVRKIEMRGSSFVKNDKQRQQQKNKRSTTAATTASWLGDVLHPTLRKVREGWGTRPNGGFFVW